MASKHEVKRYRANLSDELHSAALYETLAGVEKDTRANRSIATSRTQSAIMQCAALSMLALASIGVFTSLFNGRSAGFSASRQIVIGLVAAAFTFGVGRLLGVSIS